MRLWPNMKRGTCTLFCGRDKYNAHLKHYRSAYHQHHQSRHLQPPRQRGSNENTNRLLRQYLPKGTDLSQHSQAYLDKIARQLNERRSKILQFEAPAKRFNQCVALID